MGDLSVIPTLQKFYGFYEMQICYINTMLARASQVNSKH